MHIGDGSPWQRRIHMLSVFIWFRQRQSMDDLCTHRSTAAQEILLSAARRWRQLGGGGYTQSVNKNKSSYTQKGTQLSYARAPHRLVRVTVSEESKDVVGRRCCWRSRRNGGHVDQCHLTVSSSAPKSILFVRVCVLQAFAGFQYCTSWK